MIKTENLYISKLDFSFFHGLIQKVSEDQPENVIWAPQKYI